MQTRAEWYGKVITAENVESMCQSLSVNTTVLDIRFTTISHSVLQMLLLSLREFSITTLTIAFCKLQNESADILAQFIKNHPTLQSINLKHNDICANGAIRIKEALCELANESCVFDQNSVQLDSHYENEMKRQIKTEKIPRAKVLAAGDALPLDLYAITASYLDMSEEFKHARKFTLLSRLSLLANTPVTPTVSTHQAVTPHLQMTK